MKRYIITLVLALVSCTGILAMSYERAREEALYLTDKMAYELNLNNQQYNDAYEINLDYFLSINSERDLYGNYLSYRLTDFRYILHDWQYSLMMAAHYFVRPVCWRAGAWHFPIYGFYTHGHFFYSRPTVYISYRGGHGHQHHHGTFYAKRRPVWQGGLRGNDRSHSGRPDNRIADGRGNSYHFDLPGRESNRVEPNRGNAGRGNDRSNAERGATNGNVMRGNIRTVRGSGTSGNTSTRGTSAPTARRGDSFVTSSSRRGTTPSLSSGTVSRGSANRSSGSSAGKSIGNTTGRGSSSRGSQSHRGSGR